MVQIAPVNYEYEVSPFDYLVVTRVHPVGRIDRLRVSPRFRVRVDRHDGRSVRFELDAVEAEDLVHAMAGIVDASAGPRDVTAVPTFDVELGWDGRSVRVHGLTLAEDAAIGAVLRFAQEAFEHGRAPLGSRRSPRSRGA